MSLPFSQACENNKRPILDVLKQHLPETGLVLEVGSGTGQHAAYFSEQLPSIQWQPSDRASYLDGINRWRQQSALKNFLTPLTLDVKDSWPTITADAVFSANTLHIMSWPEAQQFFKKLPSVLKSGGVVCVYGPFNYGGKYTSESNAAFDQMLKARDPLSGIRDFEAANKLANGAGLSLLADYTMPANNRCLLWDA